MNINVNPRDLATRIASAFGVNVFDAYDVVMADTEATPPPPEPVTEPVNPRADEPKAPRGKLQRTPNGNMSARWMALQRRHPGRLIDVDLVARHFARFGVDCADALHYGERHFRCEREPNTDRVRVNAPYETILAVIDACETTTDVGLMTGMSDSTIGRIRSDYHAKAGN